MRLQCGLMRSPGLSELVGGWLGSRELAEEKNQGSKSKRALAGECCAVLWRQARPVVHFASGSAASVTIVEERDRQPQTVLE